VTDITDHLQDLHRRIGAAAARAGRKAASVRILAVSKGQPLAAIEAGMRAGLGEFGESYLQEALPKIQAAGRQARWHFIGQLQANKTRAVAEHFDCVQSVTSERLARRLDAQRPWHAGPLDVLIQLRPANAPARSGIGEDGLAALAAAIGAMPRLQLRGLMLVPLPDLMPAALAAEYSRAAGALARLRTAGFAVDTLSLGMSADLETAILAGSTMVRIGSALFGPRPGAGREGRTTDED